MEETVVAYPRSHNLNLPSFLAVCFFKQMRITRTETQVTGASVWTPLSQCGANSAALTGTLGVAATGVDPSRNHACHSEHVTRRSARQGEAFTCLGLRQEVTLKHLATEDSRQPYREEVSKTRFVSNVEVFLLSSTGALLPNSPVFSAAAYEKSINK